MVCSNSVLLLGGAGKEVGEDGTGNVMPHREHSAGDGYSVQRFRRNRHAAGIFGEGASGPDRRVCFGSAGAVGIPAYLLTRGTLGNTGAMFLMLGIMLPAFLLAMYEKDGLPFEKVVRNIIRAKFLRPGIRAYRTENIYAPFAGPGAGKEDVIEKHKEEKRSRRQG